MLSEVLVFPKPKEKPENKKHRRLNHKAICITEETILEGLKTEKREKGEEEAKNVERKAERERKRIEREELKKRKEKSC